MDQRSLHACRLSFATHTHTHNVLITMIYALKILLGIITVKFASHVFC